MTCPGCEMRNAFPASSYEKEGGRARAVGVSCHRLGALQGAAQTDWTEVVSVRINPAGVNMDTFPSKAVPVIEGMYASGKAIYGMKVLGCGQLAGNTWSAIQYVLRLGTAYAITVGTSRQEQLHENLGLVEELAPQSPLRTQ